MLTFSLAPAGDSISGGLHFRHGGFPDGTLSGKTFELQPQQLGSILRQLHICACWQRLIRRTPIFQPATVSARSPIGSPGWVDFGGSLADKSAFSQGTLLCDDDTFPVFDSLYNDKGMIQGWVGLTNSPTTDLTGDIIWGEARICTALVLSGWIYQRTGGRGIALHSSQPGARLHERNCDFSGRKTQLAFHQCRPSERQKHRCECQ